MIEDVQQGLVRGYLHLPEESSGAGLVLAHGAGSNANSKLLVAVARAFAERGFEVLRVDLPFRQQRPTGPPHPSLAAKDRAGLAETVEVLRSRGLTRVFLGGHSYGGRQATMIAADDASIADALLLLSYPLHPPRKPEQMRTAHFARLQTPALFVHGSRDPFGTPEEMRAAIPPHAELMVMEAAAHELKPVIARPAAVVDAFLRYTSMVGG
jgi:predicted alpha/beta-hydrolase family hydrolase